MKTEVCFYYRPVTRELTVWLVGNLIPQTVLLRTPPHNVTVSVGNACCGCGCGVLVPLEVGGIGGGYGKSLVTFNLAASPVCGIPIARVLRGDIEGLIGRDELAGLNPSCGSIRLRIKVSNHSPVCSDHELTHPESGPATKNVLPRSA